MASKVFIEVIGLKEMIHDFEKAAQPVDFKLVANFEKTFSSAFRAVRTATHVDTGKLRLSGVPRTHFDGDEWSGDMEFAGNPGVFELARGDTPSRFHPEGGHFFFNAVEAFMPSFADNVDAVFRAAFSEGAPI